MALVPGVATYDAGDMLLKIAQSRKTNAERRSINRQTDEFIQTQEERIKQQNAEAALATQSAGMKSEVLTDKGDRGAHITQARAAEEKQIATDRTETKKQEQFSDFYDVNKIKSAEDHQAATIARLQEGEDIEEIKSHIGTSYSEPFMRAQRARQAELERLATTPESVQAQSLQGQKDSAAMDRTKLQSATAITTAQIANEGRLAAARMNARASAKNLLPADPASYPGKPQDFMDQVAAIKTSGNLFMTTSPDSKEVSAIAHEVDSVARGLYSQAAIEWTAKVQAGMPLDYKDHPDWNLARYHQRALSAVMGLQLRADVEGGEKDKAFVGFMDAVELDMTDPNSPQRAQVYSIMQLLGVPYNEAVRMMYHNLQLEGVKNE